MGGHRGYDEMVVGTEDWGGMMRMQVYLSASACLFKCLGKWAERLLVSKDTEAVD